MKCSIFIILDWHFINDMLIAASFKSIHTFRNTFPGVIHILIVKA